MVGYGFSVYNNTEETMLLNQKTVEKFNYSIDSLTVNSHKKIIVECDYCKNEYECVYKNRTTGYKKLPKDACIKCKFKKREEVSLVRDGVKNSAQRKDVRAKISEASSDRLKSEEHKNLIKSRMIEKYGVDNYWKSPENRDKNKKALIEKYGVDNIMKLQDISEEAFKKAYQTRLNNGSIKTYNGKTVKEIIAEKGCSKSGFNLLVRQIGIENALKKEKNITSIEQIVIDILDKNNISYKMFERIHGRISDITINNLVIECNGNFWHSEKNLERSYHAKKRLHYIKHGYTCLFFRSDEIIDSTPIVESIILNKLSIIPNRIFARKCNIQPVPKNEAKEFFKTNHLMGYGRGETIGLYTDKLVMAGQFCSLGDNKWDLSRMCPALNTTVIGGYSRILKEFEKRQPKYLRNFIDLRYGSGEYLSKLGFNKSSCYLSFKWTNGNSVFGRLQFKGNDGYENNLTKIWDCGQQKWEKFY